MRLGLAVAVLAVLTARSGELMRIVREPTAGVVAPRTYYAFMSTFPHDGLRFALTVGLVSDLMLGVGYGGWNVTGIDDAEWFDHAFFKVRFRFLDESLSFPALAIGYDAEEEQYRAGGIYSRHQRGFYMVGSKNFRTTVGDLAFHAGASLSPKHPEHAGCWIGADASLPAGFGLAVDYDPATSEDPEVRFDESGGFLQAEVFWESYGQVRVSIQFLDLLEAGGSTYRSLSVDFLGLF